MGFVQHRRKIHHQRRRSEVVDAGGQSTVARLKYWMFQIGEGTLPIGLAERNQADSIRSATDFSVDRLKVRAGRYPGNSSTIQDLIRHTFSFLTHRHHGLRPCWPPA
jgi:hypothetical protein